MKMMNDKEFRQKCRKISNANVNRFIHNGDIAGSGLMMCDREDADSLKAAALLYIAANMPSSDESDEKPCEYCDPEKPKIFKNPCGAVSHYLYINSKQKKLADVYDKTEDNWIAIKYCPFCRRQL